MDTDRTISFPTIGDTPQEAWKTLMQKNTFFAHMSVGYDILDGARRKEKDVPSFAYPIVEMEEATECDSPGLYHGKLGHNGDPIAKIKSFREMMLSMQSSPPDLALMKFCYVDISADTDTEQIFSEYHKMIQQLQEALPKTRFLHCTAPLTSGPLSAKEKIKETIRPLLGKMTEALCNEKRDQYNQMLYNAFEKDTIFDIAQLESTTPEGHPCLNQGRIPMHFVGYTTDGGHLNQVGQDRLGQQFLIFLTKNAQ